MTIYLFGDSYVENEPAHFLNVRDHERWYDILSKRMNEENVNFKDFFIRTHHMII